eukprot:Phypoly_transcript_17785.p1 GENE.Phypoly_transcript_17785~~Phypoly_transcript_17785.p1  ORF type:complete len:180 (+),score=45.58 Phypoly_transcript_17785:226-765(+)
MRLTKITYTEEPEEKKEEKSEEEEERERKEREKEEWKRTLLLQSDGQSAPGERYVVDVEEEEEETERPRPKLNPRKAEQLEHILDNTFEFVNKKETSQKSEDSSVIKIFRQSDKAKLGDACAYVPTKRPPKHELSKAEKRKRMKEVMVESSQIIASADSYSYIPRSTSNKKNNFKEEKT